MRKILCAISIFFWSNLIGQVADPEIVSTTEVQQIDGVPYYCLKFDTEVGYFYRVQNSTDLSSWSDVLTFDGVGDEVVFPIVENNSSGSNPSTNTRTAVLLKGTSENPEFRPICEF